MRPTAEQRTTSKYLHLRVADYAYVDRQIRPAAIQPQPNAAASYMRGADGRLYEVSSSNRATEARQRNQIRESFKR
jgi:hypothetical protein